MVGVEVKAVLGLVCILQEARHRMGWAVGEWKLVFYADDGRIVVRDHI